MTRYVIIGGGAVGATIAAELHRAGVDTLLIARGAQLTAIRDRGLTYARPDGEHTVAVPVAAGPAEVTLTTDDVLLLTVKTPDAEAAIRDWAWQPVAGADGPAATAIPLVTLQNGLATERIALRSFARVVGAVVWVPASYVTPGVVVNHAEPVPAVLWLGHYPDGPATDGLATVASGLRQGGFTVTVVENISDYKASKLRGNLFNTLDALYRPSALRDAALKALRAEADAVYAAAGITPAPLERAGFRVVEVPGQVRSGNSTRQSLTRATTPESDYLDGEIVLLGRLHGVDTPRTAAIQARVHRAVAEGTPAASLDDADLAQTLPGLAPARPPVLIDVASLQQRIAGGRAPVLLDVRWALGDPDGELHYREGHIPGAVYVDLDTELAAHTDDPAAGRHPLPPLPRLQEAAHRWGITREGGVVVYDNSGGLAASRAWWLLRWAGVPDVRILDGGLAAWRAARHTEETGIAADRPAGDVVLVAGHLPTLTADEAAALPGNGGTLLDARAGERYRGEVEPVDPRAGHIPGAVNLPTGENLRAGVPLFKTAEELGDRFDGVQGAVGVYCGSGVTAAHQIAALAVAGIDAALYPGSWSAWSNDPSRPVATGAQP
nr:rhodanese-like domain-containing protein [Actinoplanes rectilineatus]